MEVIQTLVARILQNPVWGRWDAHVHVNYNAPHPLLVLSYSAILNRILIPMILMTRVISLTQNLRQVRPTR